MLKCGLAGVVSLVSVERAGFAACIDSGVRRCRWMLFCGWMLSFFCRSCCRCFAARLSARRASDLNAKAFGDVTGFGGTTGTPVAPEGSSSLSQSGSLARNTGASMSMPLRAGGTREPARWRQSLAPPPGLRFTAAASPPRRRRPLLPMLSAVRLCLAVALQPALASWGRPDPCPLRCDADGCAATDRQRHSVAPCSCTVESTSKIQARVHHAVSSAEYMPG